MVERVAEVYMTIEEKKLSHYDKFKCTADKCEITCCQEWKISVDNDTKSKWQKMNMQDNICIKDDDYVIRLDEHRKCPYLSKNKLCSLVINYGEDMIPHTCDIFPRQIHEFHNRTEYALVSCCPEVVRLLNETDIRELTKELLREDFGDMYNLRNLIMEIIIKSEKASYGLMEAFYVLIDILDKGMEEYDDDFLCQLKDAIEVMPTDKINTFEEVNELFLDIVENYRNQGIYNKYINEISLIAESLSSEFDAEELSQKISTFHAEMAKYDELFKKYLISELFADGILPDSDEVELTVMLQWFAMEYVLIRHAVFLKSVCQDRNPEIADVIEYMVIISRIMGYNKEDIYEYMEDCFEDIIWEWGYMALIVGKNK